ncbi:hypothetical protein DVH24_001474 [Malus domestica]|uniref:DUF1985 domain-containing protein n=1 Tax=Malus domestica TaxID=3750 RepID=A0A498JZA6_MALDO|nr:hypothetical protein DVH24_001474 [Malus domestica]
MKEMANQGVEPATKQEESYRGSVNNLSQASHVLGVLHHKFNDAHLAKFKDSCFGHLEMGNLHELSICKVANQGVKDLEGLTYLIGCEVTRFTKKDFCLITGLRCDEPYDLKKFGFVGENSKGKGKGKVVKGKGKVKTAPKKAMKKVSMTCVELETVFKQCEDEDDALKIRLVYFTKGVLIRAKSNVSMNLKYLDLVEDMDRFNTYSWGYRTTFVFLLLGEGEKERMVMRKDVRRMKRNKRGEVRGCRDPDGAAKGLVQFVGLIEVIVVSTNSVYVKLTEEVKEFRREVKGKEEEEEEKRKKKRKRKKKNKNKNGKLRKRKKKKKKSKGKKNKKNNKKKKMYM